MTNENPKLKYLKNEILNYFRDNEDSRGIVFVKTREMTVALLNWMKETAELNKLNPHNLVGSNAPSQKAGMLLAEDASWVLVQFCTSLRIQLLMEKKLPQNIK